MLWYDEPVKAISQLRDEHQGVLLMLQILERINKKLEAGEKVNLKHLEQIVEFFQVFVDFCHHSKEEGLLLPVLEGVETVADKELGATILKEHELGRGYVKDMAEKIKMYSEGDQTAAFEIAQSARAYIELLRKHIQRENDVLFVGADQVLPSEKQDKLFEGFEKIETEKIGAGRHEQFHKLMDELKAIYLNN